MSVPESRNPSDNLIPLTVTADTVDRHGFHHRDPVGYVSHHLNRETGESEMTVQPALLDLLPRASGYVSHMLQLGYGFVASEPNFQRVLPGFEGQITAAVETIRQQSQDPVHVLNLLAESLKLQSESLHPTANKDQLYLKGFTPKDLYKLENQVIVTWGDFIRLLITDLGSNGLLMALAIISVCSVEPTTSAQALARLRGLKDQVETELYSRTFVWE